MRLGPKLLLALLVAITFGMASYAQTPKKGEGALGTPVLWRDPGAIRNRNLLYGPGSRRMAPVAPFTFLEEDKDGESPKFEVKDARSVRWSVKLGKEAQAETVSTRLVSSVGYFAEEAYYFDRVRVRQLPRLSRGRKYVAQNGVVLGARFEPRRASAKRGPTWDWNKNPFRQTRELSGLKVLMILLNNFDAREANNRILYNPSARTREAHYYVTDLGATRGAPEAWAEPDRRII